MGQIPVRMVAGHDTSSALLSLPAKDRKEILYASCGSWAMAGCFLEAPIINREVFERKFSNELGYNSSINFLKFHTGLWILQECAREWLLKEGYQINYRDLEEEALLRNFESRINPDCEEFRRRGYNCKGCTIL